MAKASGGAAAPAMDAYCVKCKQKRLMNNVQRVSMPAKGGGTRPAATGLCATCGTKMFKILPKDAA